MVVGKGDNALLPVMMLGDDALKWVRDINYLSVCFYSQKDWDRITAILIAESFWGAYYRYMGIYLKWFYAKFSLQNVCLF